MEFLDELFILIVVLQGVYNLYKRVTGSGAAEEAEKMPPPEEDDGTWMLMLARARERVASARARLDEHRARARRTAEALSEPAVAPLRRAIELRLLPEFDRIEHALGQLAAVFDRPDVDPDADGPAGAAERAAAQMSDWAARSEDLRTLLGRAGRLVDNLGALEGAARWRRDPRLGEILADIDAVATSMLEPLARAAHAGWLRWPVGAPLTLPEVGDPDGVRALLADHPVVFVDPEVADEQTRWPVVIEAVARAIVQTLPGLVDDLHAARHPGVPAWLPGQQGRRIVFDVPAAAARWFPQAAVDAVAAIIMGPVALHALTDRLARPDDPFAVVRARAGHDHRTLSPDPPAHLRVAITARVLARLGYDPEARRIEARWREAHGDPEALSLPSLFGPAVGLPTARMVEALEPWLHAFVSESHPALGGHTLGAVSHLEMSPGLWGRARQGAARLAAGQSFDDSPRIVVAAALLAAERLGGFDARLDRAVHRQITGVGQRAAPDPHYRPRRADLGDPLTARDLIDAIVLQSVLQRPHGAPRRRL